MTLSDKLLELVEYEPLICPFRFEELKKKDHTYQYLEFTGAAETIAQNSFNAVVKGLPINNGTIHILLFCNRHTSLATIDRLGISRLTEILNQKIEFGVFYLPDSKIKKQLKLLLVYESS